MAVTSDAIRYLEISGILHVIVEGEGHWLDDVEPSSFVTMTGYLVEQLVAEIVAVLAYKLGSNRGRFMGSVFNMVMPLCELEFWAEAMSPGIRTWHKDELGYRFYPYTQADLRAVTRCGNPMVNLASGKSLCISQGGDGLTAKNFTAVEREQILWQLETYQLPVLHDEELQNFIDEHGDLRY